MICTSSQKKYNRSRRHRLMNNDVGFFQFYLIAAGTKKSCGDPESNASDTRIPSRRIFSVGLGVQCGGTRANIKDSKFFCVAQVPIEMLAIDIIGIDKRVCLDVFVARLRDENELVLFLVSPHEVSTSVPGFGWIITVVLSRHVAFIVGSGERGDLEFAKESAITR